MRTILPLTLVVLALTLGGCLSTIQNISDVNKADDALYLENDPETAYRLYEKAARNGDAEAQHELAKMYRKGSTVKQDYSYAQTLEEKAAAQGFAPAMRTLGFHLVNGLYGVSPDPRRGMTLLNAAAEEDDAAAHYLLGEIYARGTPDIRKNVDSAAHHFTMAEEEGYAVPPEFKNAASIERMNLQPFSRKDKTAAANTPITKAVIKDVQRALKARGLYNSSIDGIIGKGSIKAIKAFQKTAGLKPTGVIDDALLTALNLKHL